MLLVASLYLVFMNQGHSSVNTIDHSLIEQDHTFGIDSAIGDSR